MSIILFMPSLWTGFNCGMPEILVYQISVSTMKLDRVEAEDLGIPSRLCEGPDRFRNIGLRHGNPAVFPGSTKPDAPSNGPGGSQPEACGTTTPMCQSSRDFRRNG